jgi:glycosyltransferase involved in cell wall biosynthesis
MFLSIVIPTHDRFELLSKCLAAVLRETGRATDVEVVVVDDASKKAGREKNNALCKRRGVTYIQLEKRGGVSFARNCGIISTIGEWIALLDDDVTPKEGWYECLREILFSVSDDIVGIEGRVVPEGDGVWDGEVHNETGGLYLTCHMIYRSAVLRKIGGFDEHFNAANPSCEDHELASRALRWGHVVFKKSLAVTHSAKRVRMLDYFLRSAQRMHSLLEAEFYFYLKQRDMYHLFRYCQTFFGTYRAILLKHTWTTVHRRSFSKVFNHPVQGALLLCSSSIEQAVAWFLVPFFAWRFCSRPCSFFSDNVDTLSTAKFWGLPQATPSRMYRLRSSAQRALLFPVVRKPVYSPLPFLKHCARLSLHPPGRCFLRIDDVFLDQKESVLRLCEIASKKGVPFLAGVIGKHIRDKHYSGVLDTIASSGGAIGLHGFAHNGKFGPYNSEILQLPFARLSAMVEDVLAAFPEQSRPFVFMPPFNAINRDQILFLGRYFKVICGGPETARFTDSMFGPLALDNGSWYFPASYPFYQYASAIIRSKAMRVYQSTGCNICYSVHMPDEAKDGFKAFSDLLDRIRENAVPWTLFKQTGLGAT